MKPKLYINYSWVYDRTLHMLRKEKYKDSTWKSLTKYTNEISKRWKKYNDKIFGLISQTSGLKWKRKELDLYVVKKGIPMSRPLTIHYTRDFDEVLETIIHELCHNILRQHDPKMQKIYEKIQKLFKKEHFDTRNHLLIYAMEIPVLQKLFSKKRVKEFLENTKTFYHGKYYWRAVQIVQKKTPKYFLKMLK